MIGKRAEAVINRAVQHAMHHSHEYFTLEHVLWSLLQEDDLTEVVRACGADPAQIRTDLELYLVREIPQMKDTDSAGMGEQPVATLAVQRLIQRALFQVQSAGKDEIRPTDLFVALFNAKDSQALYLIQKQGLKRVEVIQYISHGLVENDREDREGRRDRDRYGGADGSGGESARSDDEGEGGNTSGRSSKTSGKNPADALSEYADNLNDKARIGKIDPVIGREAEIERVIQTLCRRRKNNPLLVGEAGVGKTAIAEGLALRIISKQVPDLLETAVIYSLDLGRLIAGAKFRGDFEQRLKKVLDGITKRKEKGELPVLFIDEIHTIIGAGSVNGSALDAANLLKPLLAAGEIRCLGSTTYLEYRNVFEKDSALTRRFQKIDVIEPSVEDTVKILEGLRERFETYHDVNFSTAALRSAVELSAKYITDRFLPDKAIDVIDEAGAKHRLKRKKPTAEELAAEREADRLAAVKDGREPAKDGSKARARARGLIDVNEIEEMISQIARIPPRSVSTSQKSRLQSLDRDLKLAIYGQDQAVDSLVTSIRLARSGLRSGEKPVGSFLLCGPTGVGKTEISKQLAHSLGVPFLRFDMSEYNERHTISRLIGAPPGYVGFEQEGLLTGAVLKQPHSVVLLDEIEKAHPEIWNILLQVMDHGTLTDNNGRKVDFRSTILLFTSNVGSREMERRGVGFGGGNAVDGKAAQKAVEQMFSPEFRNRLDATLYFNALDPVVVGHVVGKQLLELEGQLLSKKVEIEFDPEVREWLAHKGYDRLLGARPMQRLIQEELKKPLSESILFGDLEHGGHVKVTLKDDKPHFEIQKASDDPQSSVATEEMSDA